MGKHRSRASGLPSTRSLSAPLPHRRWKCLVRFQVFATVRAVLNRAIMKTETAGSSSSSEPESCLLVRHVAVQSPKIRTSQAGPPAETPAVDQSRPRLRLPATRAHLDPQSVPLNILCLGLRLRPRPTQTAETVLGSRVGAGPSRPPSLPACQQVPGRPPSLQVSPGSCQGRKSERASNDHDYVASRPRASRHWHTRLVATEFRRSVTMFCSEKQIPPAHPQPFPASLSRR